MSDKILIIGGSGFIGTALTGALLRAGHDVTLLNRGHKAMPGCIQLIADRNVAANMITIGTSNNNYQNVSFVVTDISGRCMTQCNNPSISNNDIRQVIDASSYASGLYIVTMVADNQKYSFKFVKE